MANYVTLTSDRSKKTAFLLCLFGGIIGLHMYYVGRIGRGFLYTITAGLFLLGWLTDLFKILLGTFRDNVGNPLRT
jgi:restriction system protein